MADNRFLCVHCHFYQPPRENPWIEEIELQESAFPYHDWNERISAECYGPNGQARILDDQGRVARLSNNYSRISFNFGPTLLLWMEHKDPETYQSILEGDRLAAERFGGHGSAIAQAYNHMIMPLANRRDKETQVIWGLRDFEKRFGREAEAMWLPETAVDTETLEILATHGMKYVILAPRQAKAIRPLKKDAPWQPVENEAINPRMAYRINLPGGKAIAAFFYDGLISKAIAFEGLLNDGSEFAQKLLEGFDENDEAPQLLHIATDGESYGHHHHHGEMALAYALDRIEQGSFATIDNYAHYLERFPPDHEAQIHDNSSWSCVHGIERWRSDCGCNTGGHPGWNQKWRTPLREAVDFLRDALAKPYEDFMRKHTADPWKVRDSYIYVIEDRSDEVRQNFLSKLKGGQEAEADIFKALEVQRHVMLASTSCAWFFDEISGLEGVQNLQYAARALELAKEIFGVDPERQFKDILARAEPNVPALNTGANVYERYALPARVGLLKIVAHYAVESLFSEEGRLPSLYCFDFFNGDIEEEVSGKAHVVCARAHVMSQITRETDEVEYCLIHMGDHNLSAGVRPFADEKGFDEMKRGLLATFARGDLAKSISLLDQHFGQRIYTLTDLFKDQQRKIMDTILSRTLEDLEGRFEYAYEENYPVMCFISGMGLTLPPAFSNIAAYVQNNRIWRGLLQDEIDIDRIRASAGEAREWKMPFEVEKITKNYIDALKRYLGYCIDDPENIENFERLAGLLEVMNDFPFRISIAPVQNRYLIWANQVKGEPFAQKPEWQELSRRIAGDLNVRLEP